jgi:hypothetical protein
MLTMALRTAFTELFGIRHPIALAPMGGSAGGTLESALQHGPAAAWAPRRAGTAPGAAGPRWR